MSETLEDLVDLTLDMRRQRRRQYEVELAQKEKAIQDKRIELERRQMRFLTEVRSMIRNSVARANRHLAKRPEGCVFHEVVGYLTGPLYLGGSACNPIAYELRANGQPMGETLVVELTQKGMIEASLGPFRPSLHEAHASRIDFGWHPIPLYQFDAQDASELLVRYLATIITRWPMSGCGPGDAVRHIRTNLVG
jgi:hypothetical protein